MSKFEESEQTPTAEHKNDAPGAVGPESLEAAFAGLGAPKAAGNAAAAAAWLDKIMPGATVEGQKLPGLGLLDPTKRKQFDDVTQGRMFEDTRNLLLMRLRVWDESLAESEDLESLIEKTQQRLEKLESTLTTNMREIYNAIRPLETTYRAVDGFFANAQVEAGDKIKVSFLNASVEQLLDPDDRTVFDDGLAASIQTRFRDFTLKETYGNLVIPGWAGGVTAIDRLGTLGSQNKVQVFTDIDDFETFTQLQNGLDVKELQGLKGADLGKQYLVLTGNYLLGRKAHAFEEEDLWLPPSPFLAGVIYNLDEKLGIHEAAAGYRKGKILGPQGVRFHVDRLTSSNVLFSYGVNPVFFDGYPIVMGDANLCTKEGLDSYPRIRTEDWILKNVCHYLNKQAYSNITTTFKSAVKRDLHNFLSECAGTAREIKGFDIQVVATPDQERRHEVDVVLSINFQKSVRSFNVKVKDADAQVLDS